MAGDSGIGIAGVFDFGGRMSFVSGPMNRAQRVARRLTTKRGTLLYNRDYGFDCRALLNAGMTPAQIAAAESAIGLEVEKEPDVVTADASIDPLTGKITVTGSDADGPFALVVDVKRLTVDLLKANSS